MPDDVSQIPQDVVAEGSKISKGVAQGLVETMGAASSQLTGKRVKKQNDSLEDLRKKDEEFKKKAVGQILARLQRIKAEEERLAQKREEEKRDWEVAQKEKLAPPQIERRQLPKVLPQVAKQRPETKVGWGAG